MFLHHKWKGLRAEREGLQRSPRNWEGERLRKKRAKQMRAGEAANVYRFASELWLLRRILRKSSRINIWRFSKNSVSAWTAALGSAIGGKASRGPRAGREEAIPGPMVAVGRAMLPSICFKRSRVSSATSAKAMPIPR